MSRIDSTLFIRSEICASALNYCGLSYITLLDILRNFSGETKIDKDIIDIMKNPRSQSFYHNLLLWLTISGLARMSWWGYERPHKIVMFLNRLFPPIVPLAVLSEMAYIFAYRNELTFKTLGVIFTIFPVTCIIFVNTLSSFFKSYKKLMINFMEKINLHNFRNEQFVDDEGIIKLERVIRYTSYFLIMCTMIDWFSWVFYPVITNIIYIEKIRNQTIPLNVFIYFWTPYFEYNYNVRNWIILHNIEAVLGWVGCSIVAAFTCIVYIFVYHFIGHIKALKEMIKCKFRDTSNHEETSRNLVDVIKYHIFIKKLFKELESAFGLNVTATYIHNLIGDSLLLYQVMFGEKEALISYGLMFFLYMGSLILLSFVLEEMKIQSDDLSIILYDIPWEDMSVRNRKTYLLLFSQVQVPMQFHGAGNLEAGVQPMISIIKSTFSYYVMLKSSVK